MRAILAALAIAGTVSLVASPRATGEPQTQVLRQSGATASIVSRPSQLHSTHRGVGADERLHLDVLPGALTILPGTIVLQLVRDGTSGHFRGALPNVTIVDARGSIAGWTASLVLTSIDGAHAVDVHARLFPGQPLVVDGLAEGLHKNKPVPVITGLPAALCHKDAESGGGTFTCGGNVDAELGSRRADHITLTLNATAS